MKKFGWFAGAFALLVACSGEQKPTTNAPEVDSTVIVEPVETDSAPPVHFDTLAEAPALEADQWNLPLVERQPLPASLLDEFTADETPLKLVDHPIVLENGDEFSLQAPEGWSIRVVAEGLRRVRFLTKSPDGRLFATGMHTLADNNRGKVYILSEPDSVTGRFTRIDTWLDKLRNPNALEFYTDENGQTWLYLALTEKLLRYPYTPGETAPSGEPEIVATFPAYGLSYKYGGWHLTRTPVFLNGKLYVSVGSSCNVCEEKEAVRATVLQMNPDGSDAKIYAYGLRNAVGLHIVHGRIFATNMGPDHLGNDIPPDQMYALEPGAFYGWPYYYEKDGQILPDNSKIWEQPIPAASSVARGYASFDAHASPLGLTYFEDKVVTPALRHYFLVALHGSGKIRLGKGYSISRVRKGHKAEPVITGFLQDGNRNGRPCGLLVDIGDRFFFTDDHRGLVYYVNPNPSNPSFWNQ